MRSDDSSHPLDQARLAHFERLVGAVHGDGDAMPAGERRQLARLMTLLAELPPPPDPAGDFPDYTRLRDRMLAAAEANDADRTETAFLELYCHLHMHEAPYSADERAQMDASGGYWCHAGGLSPILKAGPWLPPTARSADFGAGNGLQLLLMQRLYPHARARQIEISSRAIEIGERLQDWLEIPHDRVEWLAGDVLQASARDLDFIYLYRPVRPEGVGHDFYRRFAAQVGEATTQVVIFSIADCLRDYLSPRFEVFHGDGHLTCFRAHGDDGAGS